MNTNKFNYNVTTFIDVMQQSFDTKAPFLGHGVSIYTPDRNLEYDTIP